MLRVGVILAVAVAVLALASDLLFAGGRYPAQKVVYHIDGDGGEADKAYKSALINVRNHLNAVGDDNIDLRIVMHGDGVNLLKNAREDAPLAKAIDELKARNVAFDVCANTLHGRHIDPDLELYPVKFEIVPSGVAELSRLQQMGFTYIKP